MGYHAARQGSSWSIGHYSKVTPSGSGVLNINSGPVSGRISRKSPVRCPAGLLTESDRTNILANDRISEMKNEKKTTKM